jgi:hypothetical protein
MILVPRATVFGTQLPTNTSGTSRPLLAGARPYLTVHYTGAGSWLDPDDTPTELRSIQAYAQGAGKPWEYNWVIDGQGIVFEYAGDYRAAHTAGWNESAIGVLLLVGFNRDGQHEQPPVEMQVAFRDLRAWLTATGRVTVDHRLRQHREMPGAATACPGAAVISKWDQFSAPVPPPIGDDMPDVFYRNAEARAWDGAQYPPGQIKYKLMEDGHCRRISGDELADRGYPNVDIGFGLAKSNATLDKIETIP